jgi:hypothetical protein
MSSGAGLGLAVVGGMGGGTSLAVVGSFLPEPLAVDFALASLLLLATGAVGFAVLARDLIGTSSESSRRLVSAAPLTVDRVPGMLRTFGRWELLAAWTTPAPTLWLDAGLAERYTTFADYEVFRARLNLAVLRTAGLGPRYSRQFVLEVLTMTGLLYLVFLFRQWRVAT